MKILGIIICIFLAATAYILSTLQFMEKGILLNNAWLYASPEERITMDKKPHYKQSGIVFLLIGIIFTLDAIWVITGFKLFCYLVYAVVTATVVYAIVSSIYTGIKK